MISISHIFDGKAADASEPPKVIPAMAEKIKKTTDSAKRKKLLDLVNVYQNKVIKRPMTPR